MDKLRRTLAVLREYAKDYVLENTGLKVLALLITAVIWLSVALRPVGRVTLHEVPIEFANLADSANLTVSKFDTLTAQVYLEGPRDVVDSLRPSEVSVLADMSDVEPGVRVRQLSLDTSRLPASIKNWEVEPRSIRVTVEKMIEKEVAVVPRFDGQPPAGYEVISWQVSPASVHVVGAESLVKDITQVSTETVRLGEKTSPFSNPVAIDIGSPNISISDPNRRTVMLTVNIGELRKERVLERVPVVIFDGPPNARATPTHIKVTLIGARSVIDELTTADVNVAVEYLDSPGASRAFTPKVTISPKYADKVSVRVVEPATIRIN
jgi:YbbR domain-containing protein